MRRLNKRPVNISERKCLQNNNQWQCQRHISDNGAKFGIQHDKGAKPDIAKHGIDHAAFRQNHIPGKYPNKIACEKRNNQQKHSPAAGVFRHPESQRVSRRKSHRHDHQRCQRRQPDGQSIRIPEIIATHHLEPVLHLKRFGHAIIAHDKERHRHKEK